MELKDIPSPISWKYLDKSVWSANEEKSTAAWRWCSQLRETYASNNNLMASTWTTIFLKLLLAPLNFPFSAFHQRRSIFWSFIAYISIAYFLVRVRGELSGLFFLKRNHFESDIPVLWIIPNKAKLVAFLAVRKYFHGFLIKGVY